MNSSNIAGDRTIPSHEDEVNIPVVEEIVGESETDKHSPNQPPGFPVEVFTTMLSIFWSGMWHRHSPNMVHCLLLALRIYILKGGVGWAGGSGKFLNTTGVFYI